MHYVHYPERNTGQCHTNLLGGFPKGRLSDGFAWFDVTRDDAQPAVFESRIAASDEKNFVSPYQAEHGRRLEISDATYAPHSLGVGSMCC